MMEDLEIAGEADHVGIIDTNYFKQLPPEIMEKIFLYPVVKDKELCNLSSTCSTFRDILLVNEFWRMKFLQRWPECQPHISTPSEERSFCWRSLYSQRTLLKKDVASKLKELSRKTHNGQDKALLIMEEGNFYNYDTLPVFSDEKLNLNHEKKLAFIVSELLEVHLGGDKRKNLNARHFSEKSLWYLCHLQLEEDVKAFTSRPVEERDVEEGAVLIARWFQPTLSFTREDIKGKLDKLASSVREKLFESHPDHPIFKADFQGPSPSSSGSKESAWNPHDCRLILTALEETLKPLLRRYRAANMQEYFVQENSFINLVLENYKGIPISLSLVVMMVARRLGLILEPVNFPRHFILRWLERPVRTGIDRYSFVDVFNGDYSLTYRDLVENFTMPDLPVSVQHCDSCTNSDVLQRMLRNLVALFRHSHQGEDILLLHHACQLYILFFPQDLQMNLLEIEIQLLLGINLPKATCMIEELASSVPWLHARLSQLETKCKHAIEKARQEENKTEIKRRCDFEEVRFSVGMVMRHRRYDYLCVIYGWDEDCKASRDWINQMGVGRRQEKEPFYNVMVMDGSYRYACQENLLFTTDTCEITHPMVGLYFDSFNGRYYTPCESLLEEYPDDAHVTHTEVTEYFNSQSSTMKIDEEMDDEVRDANLN